MAHNTSWPGREVTVWAAAVLVLAGCGSRQARPDDARVDGAVHRDAGPARDLASDTPIDGSGPLWDMPLDQRIDGVVDDTIVLPDTGAAPSTGSKCTSGSCGPGMVCLLIAGTWGVCTRTCTPDNPKTVLINEDSCPDKANNICGTLQLTSGTGYYCMRKCTPKPGKNDCAPGIACHPGSGYYSGNQMQPVCLLPGCVAAKDCPVTTGQACDTTKNNCPAGQTCTRRMSGSTIGVCAKPGVCDGGSGLCSTHGHGKAAAKVGDPCASDLDCGGNMQCLMELDESKFLGTYGASCTQNSDCCSGICLYGSCAQGPCVTRYRNGYCTVVGCSFASTLTIRACGAGSVCNHAFSGGLCQKSCTLASAASCRGHGKDYWGDYECRAWNNIPINGVPASKGPVCDFGFTVPCKTWYSSGSDCSAVGDATNSTKMSCRDLKGKVLSNKYDPDGYCHDTTASGTTYP